MKLGKLTPNLMVEDVNKTVDFYREVLGFSLTMSLPKEGTFEWAQMQNGETEIMFQSRKSMSSELDLFKEQAVGASLTFFIDLKDVEKLYMKVRDEITVLADLHVTFYGTKEFSMQDINGYILTFAQMMQ